MAPPRPAHPLTEHVASYGTRAEAEAHVRALQRAPDAPAAFVAACELQDAAADTDLPASLTVGLGAASSAIGAAVVVGLFGALDPTISPLGVLALAFYALLFGAVGGALIGGLVATLRSRPDDEPPPETFAAGRFDVLVVRPVR